jgi:hypothetical protein
MWFICEQYFGFRVDKLKKEEMICEDSWQSCRELNPVPRTEQCHCYHSENLFREEAVPMKAGTGKQAMHRHKHRATFLSGI